MAVQERNVDIKPGYSLKPDQRADPVVWYYSGDYRDRGQLATIPRGAILVMLAARMGDGRSKRLTTWGRSVDDPDGPHWIGVRSGTTLHTDPRYPRYTHQLVVFNQGWNIAGLDMRPSSVGLGVGDLFCCDTHSPHILLRDGRHRPAREDIYYLAVSMDSAEPMGHEDVIGPLVRFATSWDYSPPC